MSPAHREALLISALPGADRDYRLRRAETSSALRFVTSSLWVGGVRSPVPGPRSSSYFFFAFLGYCNCACAAARRAIGTRNGEQLT